MQPVVCVERPLRRDVVVGALVAIAALVLACLALKVWRGDLGVPFSYREETQYYLMLAKSLEDHGGYFENPSLGAPFGQELQDFAVGTDRLNLDLLRVLLLFGSPAAAVNVFYLLTFPLAAAAAYLVFRLLGVSRAAGVVSALLFALAPYHFERGEGNLFLTAYWAVPLGAYLVLATLGGIPLFRRRKGASGLRAYATWWTLMTIAFCVAVASTGIYYAVFTLLLLAGATLIALAARVSRAAVAGGAVCLALILAGVLVHLAPSIAYRSANGANAAAERHPRESELFALKLSDLVFPIDLHRIELLARFTAEYKAASPIRSEPMGLGPVAAAGFVALLIVALAVLVGARAGPPVLRHSAAAALLAFLIGTVGGLSTVIAQLVTPQIRGWNRISIFIAFFAFLAVAVGLGALGRRLGTRPLRQAAFVAVLGAVLVFGLYNQITYVHVPPYELASSYADDRRFVSEIDRRLPEGAAVFQLPHLPFPEGGQQAGLFENDLLRGYLHSDDLRWSFGATKGRPEEWVDDLAGLPTATVLDAAVAVGFAGLYVDRFGYPDGADALESEVRARLSSEPITSGSGRLSFFDLREHASRLEAEHSPEELAAFRQAVLEPFRFEESGFLPLERSRSNGLWFAWADAPDAELRIVNPSDAQRTAVFEATLDRVGGTPADVVITFPGAAPTPYRTPAQLRRRLTLPPGETVIRFATGAPEVPASAANRKRPHYFRVARMRVVDSAFGRFLPG
jgi:phosphoglycerol transferase